MLDLECLGKSIFKTFNNVMDMALADETLEVAEMGILKNNDGDLIEYVIFKGFKDEIVSHWLIEFEGIEYTDEINKLIEEARSSQDFKICVEDLIDEILINAEKLHKGEFENEQSYRGFN